jgi:hypothetical protein
MVIEIRQLDKSSLSDQLAVYRAAFNPTKVYDENREMWVKKHYENPTGDSLVFGAYCDGKLAGMNSYMPVEYAYQGETIPMLQSCESGVMPEFQGKGIWSKVVCYAIDFILKETKYQAVIGFPNYVNSYPGFKKMGWETLFEMENYVMINSAKVLADSVFKNRQFFRLLGRFSFLQRIGIFLKGCCSSKYKVDECGVEDLIWEDKPDVLSVTHTMELIDWKKAYKGIKAIAIKKDNRIQATCIYSLSDYDGSRIVKLEKCCVSRDSSITLKAATALLCKYLLTQHPDAAFVRVWAMPNSEWAQALKGLFFVKSSHPNPFIIKEEGNTFSKMKWDLSFFDLD